FRRCPSLECALDSLEPEPAPATPTAATLAAPAPAAAAFPPCRTNASSDVANASADGYRSAEVFARHRKIIRSNSGDTAGFRCEGAIGSACKICAHTALTELPSNGANPVTIWYKTIPSENRSDRVFCGSPKICSGERYAGVPIIRP